MTETFDIVIVGAGMAGASLAAQVGDQARVLVIEAEARAGYHTTGRSAAFWSESYGGPHVHPLTCASGTFLEERGFLSARGALTIGRYDQEAAVQDFADRYAALGVSIELMRRDELETYIPSLRPEWTLGAMECSTRDIDVGGLHQYYLAEARRYGVDFRMNSVLAMAAQNAQGWTISLEDGSAVRSAILVNAAGAWADSVAERCGVLPLMISPLRRTMVQLRISPTVEATMPLVLDIAERFYFKPESGRLWLSPHDETPSMPCDAAPEEWDVAQAIDRMEQVVDWQIEHVEHRWAGLRSFSPDRLPVYGFDPFVSKFFWCAGQGGFGIQTAPAAAELAAALLMEQPQGLVDPTPYMPQRFS